MSMIPRKQAAGIAGMHEKTLEVHLKKSKDLRTALGYKKDPISGHVDLDEQKVREHYAKIRGVKPEELGPTPEAVDAVAIVEKKNGDLVPIGAGGPVADLLSTAFLAAMKTQADVALLPHKLWLSLDDAKALTGFPKTELHSISVLKFGRRVISRKKLEALK